MQVSPFFFLFFFLPHVPQILSTPTNCNAPRVISPQNDPIRPPQNLNLPQEKKNQNKACLPRDHEGRLGPPRPPIGRTVLTQDGNHGHQSEQRGDRRASGCDIGKRLNRTRGGEENRLLSDAPRELANLGWLCLRWWYYKYVLGEWRVSPSQLSHQQGRSPSGFMPNYQSNG